MNKKLVLQKLPLLTLAVMVVCAALAFQQQPVKAKPAHADTLPDRSRKVRNIDDALEELERSKADVDRSLKEIDFSQMEKEIQEATKNLQLDTKKMQEEIAQAMKEVDAAKINANVQKSLQELNEQKMKAELDKNLKAVDWDKMKAEIENSVAKVDWDKIHAELENAKTVNLEKVQSNLKQIRPEIEKSMKQAHESIEKAKKELTGYKNFIDGLSDEGLISKKNDYTIEYKAGKLIINGTEQPTTIIHKYQSFLKEKKDFTIQKSKDDFNIKND
jgi:chromosome segregation ATPase